MTDIKRRDMLGLLGAAPAAAFAFTWTSEEAMLAAQQSQGARVQAAAQKQPYTPRFFSAREYAVIVLLGDMIIPKDERSGSASDAGAPEFIDYIVSAQPERQTAMRGGLVWLDTACRGRFDKAFLECSDAERRQVLDEIAFPRQAKPALQQGARFFSTMRDLVATGFWSSKIGVEDLGYLGNRAAVWDGPPPAVLAKLGL